MKERRRGMENMIEATERISGDIKVSERAYEGGSKGKRRKKCV